MDIELLNVQTMKQFHGRYQGHAAQNAYAENPGFGLLHYALIRNMRPEHVLCLGSRGGFIPAFCALACHDNGKGFVDFVDAGFNANHPKGWAGVGLWSSKNFNAARHFGKLADFIAVHVELSRDFCERTETQYEYIHVDADHSYEGVKDDFDIWWPRLLPGGIVAFHDATRKRIHTKLWGDIGVARFLDEIHLQRGLTVFELQFGQGLAMIQKGLSG